MTCYCGRYSCPKCGVGEPGDWPERKPSKPWTPEDEARSIQRSAEIFDLRMKRKNEKEEKKIPPKKQRSKKAAKPRITPSCTCGAGQAPKRARKAGAARNKIRHEGGLGSRKPNKVK